jgi:hypothetical protein
MSRRTSPRQPVKKALPKDEVDLEEYESDDSVEEIRRVMVPLEEYPADQIEDEESEEDEYVFSLSTAYSTMINLLL